MGRQDRRRSMRARHKRPEDAPFPGRAVGIDAWPRVGRRERALVPSRDGAPLRCGVRRMMAGVRFPPGHTRHERPRHHAHRPPRLHHPRPARRRRDHRRARRHRLEPPLPPGLPRPGARGRHPDGAFVPPRRPGRDSSAASWTPRGPPSPAPRRGSEAPGFGGGASLPARGWSPTARSTSARAPEASTRPAPEGMRQLDCLRRAHCARLWWWRSRSRTPTRARPNATGRWRCGSCGGCTAAGATRELRAEFLARCVPAGQATPARRFGGAERADAG